jgi:hypothetical protein
VLAERHDVLRRREQDRDGQPDQQAEQQQQDRGSGAQLAPEPDGGQDGAIGQDGVLGAGSQRSVPS